MRGALYLFLAVFLVFIIALSVFNGGITGKATLPSELPDPDDPPPPPPPPADDGGDNPEFDGDLQDVSLSPIISRFMGLDDGETLISIKQFRDMNRTLAIKGIIIKVTSSHVTKIEDKCVDATTLNQYYIEDKQVKIEEIRCENNCYDGKCLEFSCRDSDGDNVNILGFVEGVGPENNIYYMEDYCVMDNVREFICVNDLPQDYDFLCEFGCDSGKCKKRIQEFYGFDSDGRYAWFTPGFITGRDENGDFREDDKCYNSYILTEFYYTGAKLNGKGKDYIGCFNGCKNGACISLTEENEYHSICLDHYCAKVEGPGENTCSANEDCGGEEGSGMYKAFVMEENGTKKCVSTTKPGEEPCLEDEPTDKIYCSDLEGVSCGEGRCVGKYVATDDVPPVNCCVGTCLNPFIAGLNNILNSFS
ncbi:MAG: hypothetical protein ABIJ20_00495 [Nanoarchaeota archaeon]|nr:hypothetical protein [Nanoarchaeota archaeon]MBU1445386.1 hypothetical protein [Nanoarchaeota archaeon]MBU2420159.1 hypothetical protein [Nanoarchaeota archaeon]MBU2475266.1 hypothetical protein [Nanoarchaeota archaeon]